MNKLNVWIAVSTGNSDYWNCNPIKTEKVSGENNKLQKTKAIANKKRNETQIRKYWSPRHNAIKRMYMKGWKESVETKSVINLMTVQETMSSKVQRKTNTTLCSQTTTRRKKKIRAIGDSNILNPSHSSLWPPQHRGLTRGGWGVATGFAGLTFGFTECSKGHVHSQQ